MALVVAMLLVLVFGRAPPWEDLQVTSANREPIRASFFAYETLEKSRFNQMNASERFLSLDGQWRFVPLPEPPPWEDEPIWTFTVDDSTWGIVEIPGCWGLQGFGAPP